MVVLVTVSGDTELVRSDMRMTLGMAKSSEQAVNFGGVPNPPTEIRFST